MINKIVALPTGVEPVFSDSMFADPGLTPSHWLPATRELSFEQIGLLFATLMVSWETGERADHIKVGVSAFGLLPSEIARMWSLATATAYDILVPFVLGETQPALQPYGRA